MDLREGGPGWSRVNAHLCCRVPFVQARARGQGGGAGIDREPILHRLATSQDLR
jgi:hypothetical protein